MEEIKDITNIKDIELTAKQIDDLSVVAEKVMKKFKELPKLLGGTGLVLPENYNASIRFNGVSYHDDSSDEEESLMAIVLYKKSFMSYEELKEISDITNNPYLFISSKKRTILDYLLQE